MEKKLPVELLCIIENWFRSSITCVRWGSITTLCFKLSAGVRQGGALSPCLFAIFIDSIINKIICCGKGFHLAFWCVSIILYVDDIRLLSPSVTSLQSMFNICDEVLQSLNMYINPSKSVCMHIGPRCKQACLRITTNEGMPIPWRDTCRYLVVYLTCAKKFQANFDHAKSNFYRAFNGIMAKAGRSLSHDIMVHLLRSKCLSILLYGTEACNPVNKVVKWLKSLDYVITCAFLKIFCCNNLKVITDCKLAFGFDKMSDIITTRRVRFLSSLTKSTDLLKYLCNCLL